MPLYELKCIECDHEFEEEHKLADVDNAKCPKCGGKTKIEIRNNPGHYRHLSWSSWRIGHGDS